MSHDILPYHMMSHDILQYHMMSHDIMWYHMILYSVHLTVQEKVIVKAGRDGGLQNMEVLGMMQLKVSDPQYGRILIAVDNQYDRSLQFQVWLQGDDDVVTMKMYPCRLIRMLIRGYLLRTI